MNLRQAAQQALEALVTCCAEEWRTLNNFGMKQVYDEKKVNAAIAALHAALAEPEQQPVAWRLYKDGELYSLKFAYEDRGPNYTWEPLYTASTPRKPLTDEEISVLWEGHTVPVFDKTGINPIVFARAIERAHGIGDSK